MKNLFTPLLILALLISTNSYSQKSTNKTIIETFEYLYFKASWADKSQSKIEVRWATGNEINCALYEVQKSSDNVNWESISKVKGQGTTDIITMYYSMDSTPIYYPSVNHYRLKQTDTQGSVRYSRCIEVFSFPESENTATKLIDE